MIRGSFCVPVVAVILTFLEAEVSPFAKGNVQRGALAAPASATGVEGRRQQNQFVTDRRMSQLLAKAQAHLDGGRHSEAITALQYLLDQDRDFFINSGGDDQGQGRSVKSQALKLIGELPDAARRAYALEYGVTAQEMLDDAVARRDVDALQEVPRRYFHTKAGHEATYRLASYYLDHSEPLAAARHFERLRALPGAGNKWEPMLSLKTAVCWARAGARDRAARALNEFKEAHLGEQLVTLGGKDVPLFESGRHPIEWLAAVLGVLEPTGTAGEPNWQMFAGNPSRNAVSVPATPVADSSWAHSTVTPPNTYAAEPIHDIEAELEQLEAEQRGAGGLALPVAHPVVVNNAVIFRTPSNIRAVELSSGALLWETAAVDPSYEAYIEYRKQFVVNPRTQRSGLEIMLEQRAWRDATAGTLSSDGRRVYAVGDLAIINRVRNRVRGGQQMEPVEEVNKLTAFECSTGKVQWEIGGARSENALVLAGSHFLGAPLPLDGKLYCLAEESGEIRLVVIDPETGAWEWSQPLVLAHVSLAQYPIRRLAGISPSYGNGVLVCPTASGAVVGVDLAQRSILWGYEYDTNLPQKLFNRRAAIVRGGGSLFGVMELDAESRWLDSVPVVAGGRVLLTPRDSDDLHCLNLLDGTVEWKLPRGQNLYVATADREKVVVVGRTEVRALALDDGKEAWSQPTPIPMPTGRGIQAGRLYHLPLVTGEICTIDTGTGQVVARSDSRSGRVYGNLVAARGTMVSQSVDEVVGFQSLQDIRGQVAAKLDESPDDPQALALRGEMRLHQGEIEPGLADLRRAIELGADSRARRIAVETLLEGMRLDFAKYREAGDEIKGLIESPAQRARYLRLAAEGLHELNELEAAFGAYTELAGLSPAETQSDQITGSHTARGDRWVRPRVAKLYRQASLEIRRRMDAIARRQLESAAAADSAAPLRQFVSCFYDLPVADLARRALIERLDERESPLELEFLCNTLRRSGDERLAAFGTGRLALLLIRLKRTYGIDDLVQELATKWAKVVCLENQTGTELVERWRSDEEIAARLEVRADWPEMQLRAERSVVTAPSRRLIRSFHSSVAGRSYPVNFSGPRPSFLDNWMLEMDEPRQHLIARDPLGNEQWRFATNETGRTVPNPFFNYVRAHGHLVTAVFGNHFAVLDTLAPDDTPRLLWTGELQQLATGESASRGVQVGQIARAGGGNKVVLSDTFGRPLGSLGPIAEDYLCYQKGTRLIAADPLTGEVLWERREVARGSELFGDEEFVFVVPPGSRQAAILRAADGEEISSNRLPQIEERLITQGRYMLSSDTTAGNRTLSYVDLLSATPLWKHDFHADSEMTVVRNDEVAVLEPQGRFVVLGLEDGLIRVQTEVDPIDGVEELIVRRTHDRYVLLCRSRQHQQEGIRLASITPNDVLINGYAYGIDRNGGQLIWKTPVEQQAISLSQPEHLPFFVLMVRNYRVFRQGRIFSQSQQFSMLILDQRSGHVVYEQSGAERLAPYRVRIESDGKSFAVEFLRSVIEVAFTETPLGQPPLATESTRKHEPEGDD